MKGKRISQERYAGRYLSKERSSGRRSETRRNGAMIRIMVCAFTFVVLVLMKLLLPNLFSGFAGSTARLIDADVDFREAFAAVGRAVSGEGSVGDSLQEAYTAVFRVSPIPEKKETAETAEKHSVAYTTRNEPAEPVSNQAASDPMLSGEDAAVEALPLSGDPVLTIESGTEEKRENFLFQLELPSNAGFEQHNLGFEYVTPVRGTLTSSFGWREHPVEGGTKFHYGVDLAAAAGTEILAFADGTVFAVGESSTLGKYIILSHKGEYRTLYAHCSKILVSSGAVSVGQPIAKVGETGVSTGPHLHFELHCGSRRLNPIYYVKIG